MHHLKILKKYIFFSQFQSTALLIVKQFPGDLHSTIQYNNEIISWTHAVDIFNQELKISDSKLMQIGISEAFIFSVEHNFGAEVSQALETYAVCQDVWTSSVI